MSDIDAAPQDAAGIAAIEALVGAPLPAAYRDWFGRVGAIRFDPPRSLVYSYLDAGMEAVSSIAVSELFGLSGIQTALQSWWGPERGEYLPPGSLPIGLDGAFCPILLRIKGRTGIWYLPEAVTHPWGPEDEAKLHLLRQQPADFFEDLQGC